MTELVLQSRTASIGPFDVGRLAYGCWRFGGTRLEEARAKIGAALEAGMTLIDTAAIYGYGETGFGEAEERLGDLFAASPGLRDRVVLVTKGGIDPPLPYDSSAGRLIASVEQSLVRLRSEVIDLFLIHRPDFLTPHDEVAAALERLLRDGKIRSAGVSNYTPAQTRALQARMETPLVATQPEFSALEPAPLYDGTLDLAQEMRLRPMAWSPLAGGALATGRGSADQVRLDRVMAVTRRIAGEQGATPEAVALAWVLAHPAEPLVLVGSQKPERIRAAARAFDVRLTRRDWYEVLEASLGAPMP